jgi:hypothetical protein
MAPICSDYLASRNVCTTNISDHTDGAQESGELMGTTPAAPSLAELWKLVDRMIAQARYHQDERLLAWALNLAALLGPRLDPRKVHRRAVN